MFSAHSGPTVSGEHDTESVRLGSKFRLFSELEQDPHAEPKVTAPLACLPKIHFLEPKAIHCTKRYGCVLCLKKSLHPTSLEGSGSTWVVGSLPVSAEQVKLLRSASKNCCIEAAMGYACLCRENHLVFIILVS